MPGNPHERKPLLKSFSEIRPEPISWLWEPYVPRRRITILEGDTGVGKTFLCCKLAAMVSSGQPWPWSLSPRRPKRGAVIVMSREDGLADTLRPRLERCGADLKRVHTLTGWENSASSGAVTLKDVDVLESAFRRTRPALVVIDPLQAFIGADVHMGSANKTRPVLAALGELAERHDTAVVIVRHLTKTKSRTAAHQGLGGVDFSAAVRSLLLAGKDPTSGEHGLVHVKSSAGPQGPSLGYRIDGAGFSWTGLSELTAADLLARDTKSSQSPREIAKQFLREILKKGPQPSRAVQEAALEAGIAVRTLKRAQEELGVISAPKGKSGARGAESWRLSLPKSGAKDDDAADS